MILKLNGFGDDWYNYDSSSSDTPLPTGGTSSVSTTGGSFDWTGAGQFVTGLFNTGAMTAAAAGLTGARPAQTIVAPRPAVAAGMSGTTKLLIGVGALAAVFAVMKARG